MAPTDLLIVNCRCVSQCQVFGVLQIPEMRPSTWCCLSVATHYLGRRAIRPDRDRMVLPTRSACRSAATFPRGIELSTGMLFLQINFLHVTIFHVLGRPARPVLGLSSVPSLCWAAISVLLSFLDVPSLCRLTCSSRPQNAACFFGDRRSASSGFGATNSSRCSSPRSCRVLQRPPSCVCECLTPGSPLITQARNLSTRHGSISWWGVLTGTPPNR